MRIKYSYRVRPKKQQNNISNCGRPKKGRGRPKKCHKACGKVCIKLPDLLYELPGSILSQLTARPLDTITQLEITSDLKKVHSKPLFESLANATALTSLSMDGNFWSGHFSQVADEMAAVLSRCENIKLLNFKETPEFWKKCLNAAGNKCVKFAVVECNGLETIVSMLPGLLPRLVSLELISPDLDDFVGVRTNQRFSSFLSKISPPSKLLHLKLDKLWSLLLDVPPADLVSSFAPLRDVSVCRTSLSLSQLVPLVRTWVRSAPLSLKVESSWGCWSQVPSMVLLPGISNIRTLSFRGTNLKLNVLEGLLTSVAGGCAVKVLDLRGNDLSSVPQHILLLALVRLKVAILTRCGLAEAAVKGVLQLLADGGRGVLEELDITGGLASGEWDRSEGLDNVNEGNSSMENMVELAKEGSGIRRLQIHRAQCRCDGYCNWCSM